mmetsp:Transcript_4954/g.10842  ORF Transcript_4954/g.10842 Transcript_4954/m.10842 type:complete len:309 (-) Transcript_4954:2823-3749(-)
MRNPQLKEHLLEDGEVELPTLTNDEDADADEIDEIEETIQKWDLDRDDETLEAKAIRLSVQLSIDRVVIFIYVILVAMSVLSCGMVLLFFPSTIFEVLFAVSIIQGPLALYQRLRLIRLRSTLEGIATLWNETKPLKLSIATMEAEINSMKEEAEKLNAGLRKYENLMQGYDRAQIADLYRDNASINEEKKQIAEAIGLQKLTKLLLQTDIDRDHWVGDAELSILAQRIDGIEGIPFTKEEMCKKFQREKEDRSLQNLADVVRNLYITKRKEQFRLRAARGGSPGKSPRNLGNSLLWKRQIDGIGISV